MDNYYNLRKQLNRYIKKYPLPPKKENINRFKTLCALRAKLPDTQIEYDDLRKTIIISNGGFAMKYAISYCKQINDSSLINDLFQQAQIGIIEAVDRFDPYRNVNFTTFAYYYVLKCIIDYLKKSNKLISVNRNIARFIKHISDARDVLFTNNNGFEPSVSDIKNYLLYNKDIDLKNDVIVQLLNLIELNSSASDVSFTTNNFDDIKVFDDDSAILLFKLEIHKHMQTVNSEQLKLIYMRFGIDNDRPYNLEEIKFIKNLSDNDITLLLQTTEDLL